MNGYLWKGVVLTLFLFLSSCSKHCQEWEYGEVVTSCIPHNSSRLIFRPTNPFRGLALELTQGCSGMRMYVNGYSLAFPYDEKTPPKTRVIISTNQENYEVLADRLEGGQRLLLPPEVAQNIISHLLACETVCLSAGRNKEEITPTGFIDAYRKFSR